MTRHTKIYCAECKDMDICLNCFANGEEAKGHKRNHKYHVINKLNFPLFVDEWTAEEELYMLEGLEKFGFGNWADISEHVGTDKTKEDLERHYEDVYMSSKKFVPVRFSEL
jgi:transcriptional adapter 2-alpha